MFYDKQMEAEIKRLTLLYNEQLSNPLSLGSSTDYMQQLSRQIIAEIKTKGDRWYTIHRVRVPDKEFLDLRFRGYNRNSVDLSAYNPAVGQIYIFKSETGRQIKFGIWTKRNYVANGECCTLPFPRISYYSWCSERNH